MKNTNQGYLDESNNKENKENVVDYIRAVIEAYMRKYENDIKTGFETVLIDRVVKWKTHQKKKKAGHFLFFLFISFLTVFTLIYFNFFIEIERFYFIVFIGSLVGLILSIVDILYIRGQIPINGFKSFIGFKKSISDLYFETFRSTQIIYYAFLLVYVGLLVIGSFYAEYFIYVDKFLFTIYNKIVSEPILLPSFNYIYKYILYTNIGFIVLDFLYIFVLYYIIPKKNFI